MKRSFLTLGLGAACAFVSAQAQTASTGPAVNSSSPLLKQPKERPPTTGPAANVTVTIWTTAISPLRFEAQCFCGNGAANPSQNCLPAPACACPRTRLVRLERGRTSIVAYMFQSNNIAPGVHELPSTERELSAMQIPGQTREAGGGLSPGVALPNQPSPGALLDRITSVTPAILAKPLASEWLTWRRTYDDQGYK